ncbi:MAG: NAD-dependent epimerase/dehydratase family protein [Bacilli bacterium]|nr:NAD-dependent epimerase/dehydratase family protein [Bacilli bacterium]
MVRILIVGANSYIGNYFINLFNKKYVFKTIDARKELKDEFYNNIDVVIHLAAIVHKNEKKSNFNLYNLVNNELAVNSFLKAKNAGVKQFIFMSSMALFGNETNLWKIDKISKTTKPNPKTYYGKSKLLAEQNISQLKDSIKVVFVRAPMVYGNGCKGNYPKLLKFAEKIPFVPNINNQRSTISVDNLCLFINKAIEKGFDGFYSPQDPSFANTKEILINEKIRLNKKVRLTSFFNPLIYVMSLFSSSIRKAFGSKIYDYGSIDDDINVRY